MHNVECSVFKRLWSTFQKRERSDGRKELCLSGMPVAMGEPVMSSLADNSTFDSLTVLVLDQNASWWKDSNLLFKQLLTLLSRTQLQLEWFSFSNNSLTSE